MIAMSDMLFLELPLMRTTLFTGRRGSGKTLVAVAIAKELLNRGMVEKVYANLPISFGNNPPEELRKPDEFDFQADYAQNAVFLLDEAWIGFMDFNKDLIRNLFAYPRHNNQFFLLTSVLPMSQISTYCFHYIKMKWNGNTFGLPIRWMYAITATYKEKTNFYLINESEYYSDYDTTYNAKHIFPVWQYGN